MGTYMRATRIWPPTPIGIPIRSVHRNRRPRSRTKLVVPLTPVASQPAPKKPTHRPRRVETTYQVGGSLSRAMVTRELALPSMAAVIATNTAATTWPPTKPMAAKSNHIHADPVLLGAPPAASWRPRDKPERAEPGPSATGLSGRGAEPAGGGGGAQPGGGGGQPRGGGGHPGGVGGSPPWAGRGAPPSA